MPNHGSPNLEPPPRTSIDDPGAHELEGSDSDDHFSDAQSGTHSPRSPIPVTRVEKVDNDPSYGEVPGTDAYNMRVGDAQPDEIAIIPEDENTKTKSPPINRPPTPGGHPIPITVVERANPASNTGELPIAGAHKLHEADAAPDVVVEASDAGNILEKGRLDVVDDFPGSPTSHAARSPTVNLALRSPTASKKASANDSIVGAFPEYDESEDGDDDVGFGDDFDDFEEGGEDAEFGDFDEGFREAEAVPVAPIPSLPTMIPSFPVLNFDDLDTPEDVLAATEPYINALFAPDSIDISALPKPAHDPIFLTQRSASLWSQLVAPPPLQPPNWIRSRIRRLFLVSLGVPVDLDEILPASKQKKLILPSTNLFPSSSSPRASTDSRTGGSLSRLKQGESNASSTSLDSQGKSSKSKRRKGPPPAPELDLNYARQLCTITDEALNGFTIEELEEHVQKLEKMQVIAKEALDYWTKRTDEKIGDREAFEGVIENLVKHARKVRK